MGSKMSNDTDKSKRKKIFGKWIKLFFFTKAN